jgi:Holliday junction DNA helicase RuvA
VIAFLRGALAAKTALGIVVDVAGVGYSVSMSANSLSKLPPLRAEVTVLTYMQVSDAGVFLYGFLSEDEKALFERLITVSGVGPKVALAALSTFAPAALADAITSENTALVSKIPGVGKKTAQRIILELKGTLGDTFAPQNETGVTGGQSAALAGAAEALLSMGFTSAEAELALKGADEGATEQQLLKAALKKLGTL